jgi:hypothetical protein
MATRTDFTQPQAGLLGESRTAKVFGRRVNMATGDLTTGNVVEAFIVPAGFTVTGIVMIASDMDSNGTPTLALSVGDAASATRFLSSNTAGQTGAAPVVAFTTPATTNVLFAYTADTKILITATTGSATAVAGTIDLYLTGFVAG